MTTAPEPSAVTWRTSSYSGGNGGCVEVGWRTSSHSGNGGSCVEVAVATEHGLVRDSKDRDGPVLTVTAAAWRAFLESVRS